MNEEELKEAARAQKGGAPNLKLVKKAAKFSMTVIKDRANVLGGHYEFEPHPGDFVEADNDIWLAVKPFCDALNIGGTQVGVNLNVKSTDIFESPDTSYQERERQKTILLEEIEAEMKSRFGQSKDDKTAGIALLKDVFGTASWTAIQSMDLKALQVAHDKIMPKAAPKTGMTGDELVQKLQDAVPVEREAGDDSIDWHKYLDMPAERYSPDEITGLCNLLDYPLAGNDPVGIKALINGKTKYYKLAVERLQKWTKGEFK
jgi:hypothetical protein